MTALNENTMPASAKEEDFFQEKESAKTYTPDPNGKAETKRESDLLTKAQLTKALEQSNIRVFDSIKELAAQIDSLTSLNGQLLKANLLLAKKIEALSEVRDFEKAIQKTPRKKRLIKKKAKSRRVSKKRGLTFKSVFTAIKKRSKKGTKQFFRMIRKRFKRAKLPVIY